MSRALIIELKVIPSLDLSKNSVITTILGASASLVQFKILITNQ